MRLQEVGALAENASRRYCTPSLPSSFGVFSLVSLFLGIDFGGTEKYSASKRFYSFVLGLRIRSQLVYWA